MTVHEPLQFERDYYVNNYHLDIGNTNCLLGRELRMYIFEVVNITNFTISSIYRE